MSRLLQPIGHLDKDLNSAEDAKTLRIKGPGKITNDKIMDRKLEEDFQALKAKSEEKIVPLTRDDIFDMLKALDMICSNRWNRVTKRDNQDALDFIEILFGKHDSFKSSENATVEEVQHSNTVLMVIFKSLIKAVLLLQEDDAEYKTLLKDKFERSPSRQFVIEKLGDL